MNYKYSIRKYLILILLLSLSIQSAYANQFTIIGLIKDIIPILEKADKNTLVVFDVDNVISAPADLIGRPKARKIRQEIFKEYENKYGIERVKRIHALYMLKAKGELVEPDIKTIISSLQQKGVPTIALTAKGTEKFGSIVDPMEWRLSQLEEKGITFIYPPHSKRVLWQKEAGFEKGVVFSGKQSKGEALGYFLKNVVKWKPKKIIFVDDNADYLKSVSYMCEENSIEFIGFQYLAEVFNQDKEINPEIAKIQIKILDEKQIWLQVNEVANYLKNNSR